MAKTPMHASRLANEGQEIVAEWNFEIEEGWDWPDLAEVVFDAAFAAGVATTESWPKGGAWWVQIMDLERDELVTSDRLIHY